MSENREGWWSCMSDESRIWLIAITGIVVLISSISWAIAWHNATVTVSAFEHGYSERQLPNSRLTGWVKE